MFGHIMLMGWILFSGNVFQAAPPPSFFIGTWNNTATPPVGPRLFSVGYRDGKTFMQIETHPEEEATVYHLSSGGSGYREGLEADALMVNSDLYLIVIKRADPNKVILEMFLAKPVSPDRRKNYVSEPFEKVK